MSSETSAAAMASPASFPDAPWPGGGPQGWMEPTPHRDAMHQTVAWYRSR